MRQFLIETWVSTDSGDWHNLNKQKMNFTFRNLSTMQIRVTSLEQLSVAEFSAEYFGDLV